MSTPATSRQHPHLLGAALVLALVAAGAVAAAMAWLGVRADADPAAQQEALREARSRVPLLLSYDVATLDDDLDRAIDQTTGEFRDDYAEILDKSVRKLAAKRGISTVAEVVGAGVVDGDEDRVTVLVLVNQTATGRSGEPVVLGSRIEVEMVPDGDTWRIAGYTPL
ncbi:hypothetical protein [Nocardioides daejeonensis]|uniref:hypothetical protein n=1 Tax=Nocardioides daejeonensis TaxID=1046556 RepID=UPI000D74FA99|nr:hypothetical protein [Nocardioides daejeonensis]